MDRMDAVPEERVDGDPQRHLFSGQVRQRIKEVLGELTPRERMVFELRHYQGLRLRQDRRSFGDHGRGGQKLPVSGDAENAGGFGRFRMKQDLNLRGGARAVRAAALWRAVVRRRRARGIASGRLRASAARRWIARRRCMPRSTTIEIVPSPVATARMPRGSVRCVWRRKRLLRRCAPAGGNKFVDALTLRPSAGLLRPAGALTLVALGFFAARMLPPMTNANSQFGAAEHDAGTRRECATSSRPPMGGCRSCSMRRGSASFRAGLTTSRSVACC